MKDAKQIKAKRTEEVRDAGVTCRTTQRIKFFAELAAQSKGLSISNWIEQLIEAAVVDAKVDPRDHNEPDYPINNPTKVAAPGNHSYKRLGDIMSDLWDEDEITRFEKQRKHTWSFSAEQHKLATLLQISAKKVDLRTHWKALLAVVRKEAPASAISHLVGPVDIEFALMGDAERIALYKHDPTEFTKRSTRHLKEMKGRK